LPFLRRAAFKEDADEWLLLLAVATIGSRYVQRSYESCDMLPRLLDATLMRRKYGYQSERDEESDKSLYIPGHQANTGAYADLRLLQAGILNIVYLLQSGKKVLHTRAVRERYYLVQACDSLALLNRDTRHDLNSVPDGEGDAIHHWLSCESKIRTGLTIWVLAFPSSNGNACSPI
jgi:hypothetical protein